MNVEITDPIGALVVLAVVLIVAWLVAYSAARSATDDLRTVVLTLSWTADGTDVVLEVENRGMKPAYGVTLRSSAGAAAQPIATIGDVRPGAALSARVPRSAIVADDAPDLPAFLRVEWRTAEWRAAGSTGRFRRSAYLPLVHAADA